MQAWEYLTVYADYNKYGRPEMANTSDGRSVARGRPEFETFAKQLGNEGWELVSVIYGNSGHDEDGNALNHVYRFFYKRPKA